MTFLRPEFLWALFVLIIPIIIHLFSFRKKRTVYFSNTRFIKQIQEETTSLKKIKQYLILASRILFLIFLVLAFAQPFIPASKQMNAGTPVLIYLDNSFSMTLQNGNNTLLEQAVGYAQNVVDAFPKETKFVLLTNNSQSLKAKSSKEITDELTQIRPSADSKPFDKILTKVKDWHNTDAFFVLSDFQEQQFKDIKADSLSYLLVPLQKENTSNIFFDSLYLKTPFLIQGEKNSIVCSLFNSGNENRSQVLVKFFLDDLQVGSLTTEVGANKKVDVVFDLPIGLQGLKKGRVSVNDAGNVFDNDFYISLDFTSRVDIVELKSSNTSNYFEKVFGNTSLFRFQSSRENNFNFENAENADLLILNEISILNSSLQSITQKIVNRGGSILIVPSEKIDVNSYQGLIPQAKINSQLGQISIKKIDYNNPFFNNVFESKQDNLELPSAQPILQLARTSNTLLSFANDQPFLSLQTGGGKVYAFASPLRLPYTNFSNNALFVPVMYKMASLSVADAKALYTQSESFFIKLKRRDNDTENSLIKLIGESEIIPAQRMVNNQIVFDLQGLSINQGHYWIVDERDTLDILAKNLPSAESYLDFIERENLIKHFGSKASILNGNDNSEISVKSIIQENYKGKPLWKLALILSVLFLLFEIALIKLMP